MTSFEFHYVNKDHKKLLYMWAYSAELTLFQQFRLWLYRAWAGSPHYNEGDDQ